MLCQQISTKRWFANVNMSSYCDVTNSVYPVTMTAIRHCSILEFGRGASNQALAPGITRPLHATVVKHATVRVETIFVRYDNSELIQFVKHRF